MEYHFDNDSKWAEESTITPKKEAVDVFGFIQVIRSMEEWKRATIFAVVREQCVPILLTRCNKYQNGVWSQKPPIHVTSDDEPRIMADEITGRSKDLKTCVVVVSGLVPEISPRIGAKVGKLRIVRVNRTDPRGNLSVSGRSTWTGTRFNEWMMRPHQRKLTHNDRVSILADNFGSDPWSTTSSKSFSEDRRGQTRSYLQEISNGQMRGSWWESAKGPIAGIALIAGLACGACKAWTVLDCSAKGVFFSLEYGPVALKAAGFSFKLSAGLYAAAPAIAVGAGAAALIYLVPWDKFFDWLGGWLKRIFSGIWDMIRNLWDHLWSMFKNWSCQQMKRRHSWH